MEDDNIFPAIAKGEDLFIEASAAIDAEAQRIAGQGLMVKAGQDVEEHESDDEAQIPIPTPKAFMEAVNTIQLRVANPPGLAGRLPESGPVSRKSAKNQSGRLFEIQAEGARA